MNEIGTGNVIAEQGASGIESLKKEVTDRKRLRTTALNVIYLGQVVREFLIILNLGHKL